MSVAVGLGDRNTRLNLSECSPVIVFSADFLLIQEVIKQTLSLAYNSDP